MHAPTLSPQRLDANRRNAQLSTGPRTEAGKAASSMNAVRTGLTGRAILLSASEADAYEAHLLRFAYEYSPAGDRELELVQRLADTQWRLNRIPALEAGIFASGRIEFAELFLEHDEHVRSLLIQNHTYLAYRRELNNLSIQESRLRRYFQKDAAELASLQAERKEAERVAAEALQALAPKPERPAPTASAAHLGFEFSTAPSSDLSTPGTRESAAPSFCAGGIQGK